MSLSMAGRWRAFGEGAVALEKIIRRPSGNLGLDPSSHIPQNFRETVGACRRGWLKPLLAEPQLLFVIEVQDVTTPLSSRR